jgi:hypothetical protein
MVQALRSALPASRALIRPLVCLWPSVTLCGATQPGTAWYCLHVAIKYRKQIPGKRFHSAQYFGELYLVLGRAKSERAA